MSTVHIREQGHIIYRGFFFLISENFFRDKGETVHNREVFVLERCP